MTAAPGWQYTKVRLLGRGSSGGEVWLYRRHVGERSRGGGDGGELVAVKKTWTGTAGGDSAADELRARRVLRERHILASVEHDNVVRVVDVFTTVDEKHSDDRGAKRRRRASDSGKPQKTWLVLELMHDDLEHVLDSMQQAGQRFSGAQVRGLLVQLLRAVDYLHARGVVHRDIKPANCLLSRAGVLKLSDFGSAKQLRDRDEPPHTREVATLWYRAPELIFGQTDYDAAVDMWALGCTLAELLRGSALFAGATELEMLARIAELLGPATDACWPGVSRLPFYVAASQHTDGAGGIAQLFDSDAAALLEQLLVYNPAARASARLCLDHAYMRLPIDPPDALPVPERGVCQRSPPHAATKSRLATASPPRAAIVKKLFF